MESHSGADSLTCPRMLVLLRWAGPISIALGAPDYFVDASATGGTSFLSGS
jgi:hypothetical protein